MKIKFASIIIPAWNDETILRNTLENLFKINYSFYEVILVAGGEDRTFEIANEFSLKYKNCKIFKQNPEGKNSAIQGGLKIINKNTDIIVLLDADTIVDKNWLTEGIKTLEKYDVANGDYYPLKINAITSFFLFEKEKSRINGNIGLYGGGTIFLKKKIIEENDPNYLFDKKIYVGIDFNLCQKLKEKNYRIGFADRAKVKTYLPSTLKEFLKQELRWLQAWSGLSKDSVINSFKGLLVIISSFLLLFFLIKKEIIISLISGSIFLLFFFKTFIKGLKVYTATKNKLFIKYIFSYIFLNYIYCFLRIYSLFSKNKTIHFKGERPK